jgi:glucose-6-phosphate isomerase
VQSVIWDINPFDQWGVELGKKMATNLLKPLMKETDGADLDGSSKGLLDTIHALQEVNA